MGILRVMDHTGDTTHVFDPKNSAEVDKAMAIFNEALKAGGGPAYKKGQDGKPNEHIRKFDPSAEETVVTRQLAGG